MFVRRRLMSLVGSGEKAVFAARWMSSGAGGSDAPLLQQYKLDNQVLQLTLNDARRRNPLGMETLQQIKKALEEGSKNETLRAIILNSTGPVFSSGHNLKELTSKEGLQKHKAIFYLCSEVMKMVQDIQVPVIASVSGLAAAAGCQLVASCDIAVASEKASFSTPGAKAGLFCSTPGIAVGRSVPKKVALDMLFTARPIDAQAALRAGLVSRVVPEKELESETMEIVEDICKLSRPVIGLGKTFFYTQLAQDRNTAYRLGARVMTENLRLVDAQEGIKAFIEKREATWTHSGDTAH